MDNARDIPTEKGAKVFYEDGEEWRFKQSVKTPARVPKVLDKSKKKAEDNEVEFKWLEEEKSECIT